MSCLLRNWLKLVLMTALCASASMYAQNKKLPAQDLVLTVRQIDERQAGYRVGTQEERIVSQQLRVSHGAQAAMQLTQNVPMLWVSSVAAQSSQFSANAGGGAGANAGGGAGGGAGASTNPSAGSSNVQASSVGGAVSQSLTWLQAGQTLVFRPFWRGDNQPVRLEVLVQSSRIDQRQGLDLPAQHSQQVSTEVSAPLGQWVTLAESGPVATPGVYRSQDAKEPRKLLQVRVSLQ